MKHETPEQERKRKQEHAAACYRPDLFCKVCKQFKPRKAGMYVTYNEGKNQVWYCNACATKKGLVQDGN